MVSALPVTLFSTDEAALPLGRALALAALAGVPAHVDGARAASGRLATTAAAAGVADGGAAAVVAVATRGAFAAAELAEFSRALQPGGKLLLAAGTPVDALTKAALVGGFSKATHVGGAGAAYPLEGGAAVNVVVAEKPSWSTGAAFSLKTRKVVEAAEPVAAPAGGAAAFAAAASAFNGAPGTPVLLNDADLLGVVAGEDDAVRNEAVADAAASGCATKRTACANCSCGRKVGTGAVCFASALARARPIECALARCLWRESCAVERDRAANARARARRSARRRRRRASRSSSLTRW